MLWMTVDEHDGYCVVESLVSGDAGADQLQSRTGLLGLRDLMSYAVLVLVRRRAPYRASDASN